MALTWATGVHLAANCLRRFRSSSGPKNAYFHELFYVLYFLVGFLNSYFVLVFGSSVF
ncbi:hypothetical protein Hanom_Chr14g01279811 [Helianthus anomalus]